MAVKYIIVQEGQSIWDLAIQEYGSTEGVLQLAVDNVGLVDFQNTPVPGTKLLIDSSKVINKDVVRVLIEKGIKPANSVEVVNEAFTNGFSFGFK